ncbi:MAG: repeat-like domain [Gemmatimonadetes bacterium]|nr:repeat-like domain [Gemmatimonadota bacterium]
MSAPLAPDLGARDTRRHLVPTVLSHGRGTRVDGSPCECGATSRLFEHPVATVCPFTLSEPRASRYLQGRRFAREHLHPRHLTRSRALSASARVGLHFFAALLVGSCAPSPSAKPPAPAEPQSLPIPHGGAVRLPTAAWYHDGWVIAGNLFPYGADAQVRPRSLYLASTSSGTLPLPLGAFFFAKPFVVTDSIGDLHLFWAEGPTQSPAFGWPSTFHELWHARLSAGSWSSPELVTKSRLLRWDPRAPQVTLDARGSLHLVVSMDLDGHEEQFVHLTRERDHWRSDLIAPGVAYASVIATSDGALVAVAITGESNGAANQLYVTTSMDDGHTWSPMTRVLNRHDTREAFDPLLRSADDSLYLAWRTETLTGGSAWSLMRASASPSLRPPRWGQPVSTTPRPQPILNASLAVVGCGGVALVEGILSPSHAPFLRLYHFAHDVAAHDDSNGDTALDPLVARDGSHALLMWSGQLVPGDSLRPLLRPVQVCNREH